MADTPASDSASPPPGARTMLTLLTLSYALAYLDRLMMAVVAEPVKAEFGLSDAQLFFLTGAAFVLIYGVCGIGSGWLLDRFSRRKIIAVMLAAWSGCTALCGLAGSFTTLALSRAGVGIGESAIVPAGMATISDSYRPGRRPLAMGIFYSGGMVSMLIAWTLGGWVADTLGWRYTFFLAGPPGILLAIAIWLKGWDPPREKARLRATPHETSAFSDVWHNRPLVWILAAGSVITFVNVGLVTQLGSFFIRSHGMTLTEVGLIFGPVLAGGMAIGLVGGGWIGNRLAEHGTDALLRFTTVIVFAMFPIYMAMFLAETLGLALFAMFLGTLTSVIYSPAFSAAYQAVSAPHTRATSAGISSFLNALVGGAMTPLMVGALSDYWSTDFGTDSLRFAMMIGMGSCFVSGVMFTHARRLVRQSGSEAAAAPPA
ncbi:MFS transporter [Croceicoccus sp. YJ47]|uniref:spinster family MFS transporter n=1 Tax=Croceicoccus sp. YJ47 TaxID=2798724 RepID=UPI001924A5D3|nr:MFS transporter [Croceicoccus sp. YJ47]QQN75266.1 MFS transporter [Croceicoccus sp. YJ47]